MPDPAEAVRLPKADLSLTRLSLGTASIAGLYAPVSESEAHTAMEAAWGLGVRYYDTAPHYGQGLAETRLGRFLAGRSGGVVSSKVGRLLRADVPLHPTQLGADGEPFFKDSPRLGEVYDYSYQGVVRSHQDSLERTGLGRVDVLYVHDPDADGRSVREVMEGGYKALADLRREGAIKAIGVGMNQAPMMAEFAEAGDFDVMLLAGRYTLLEQGGLGLLDLCHRKGIGVVAGGVFNSGLLADPRPGAAYDYAAAPAAALERALGLKAVCERHGVPLKAAALQFPLAHPAVVSVVSGARSAGEIRENADMMRLEIPLELWAELKATKLLPDHVPVVEG